MTVSSNGVLGSNVEHSLLDATVRDQIVIFFHSKNEFVNCVWWLPCLWFGAQVCGQLWSYILGNELYDDDGHVLKETMGGREFPVAEPTQWVSLGSCRASVPVLWAGTELLLSLIDSDSSGIWKDLNRISSRPRKTSGTWYVLAIIVAHRVLENVEWGHFLYGQIADSDMVVVTPSYSKRVPKKCRLSPDGWFQVQSHFGVDRMIVAKQWYSLITCRLPCSWPITECTRLLCSHTSLLPPG